MSRKTIDNSGQGNCMYYAYSISLMYFLLKKRDRKAAEQIFDRLELTETQKKQLHALLDNRQLIRFTPQQIRDTIEPILGTATRKIAGEKTGEQFLKNPSDSSLYSAMNYGMIYLFRKQFELHSSELEKLLSRNNFDFKDYTSAEIYRLFPISCAELQQWASEQYQDVMIKFNSGWEARIERILEAKRKEGVIKTREQIASDAFYKKQFIEELIGQKTIEFFTKGNNQNLNRYVSHLNTNYRWGTEETLLLLHRHVTGEQQINIGVGHDVHWDFQYETAIKLAIFENGVPKSGGAPEMADIVLNNLGNAHWVSLVELMDMSLAVQEEQSTEGTELVIIDDDQLFDFGVIDLDPPARPVATNNLTANTCDANATKVKISHEEMKIRETLLEFSGFNKYLQQLSEKANKLITIDYSASKEAFAIVNKLIAIKLRFLQSESTMTDNQFSTTCQETINDAPKKHLENHRGVGIVLNGLLDAVITLANLFIKFANLFSKVELIDHHPIATKSIQNVQHLRDSVSLTALKEIRDRELKKQQQEQASLSMLESSNTLG